MCVPKFSAAREHHAKIEITWTVVRGKLPEPKFKVLALRTILQSPPHSAWSWPLKPPVANG